VYAKQYFGTVQTVYDYFDTHYIYKGVYIATLMRFNIDENRPIT